MNFNKLKTHTPQQRGVGFVPWILSRGRKGEQANHNLIKFQ